MEILVLVLVAMQWLAAIVSTLMVGKPRKPMTPGAAVWSWLIALAVTTAWLYVR
jgi:hypothetical protein